MCFCFFFQAEDGIRDIGVTGVQTCALPILVSVAVDAKAHPNRYGSKLPVNAPLKLVGLQRALQPRGGGHIDTGACHGSDREDGAPLDRPGTYRSRVGTRWGYHP